MMSVDWNVVRCDAERALQDPRTQRLVAHFERMARWVAVGVRAVGGEAKDPSWRRLPLFLLVLSAGVALVANSVAAAPPPPLPVASGGDFLDMVLKQTDGTYVRWMVTAKGYALGLFGVLLPIQIVITCGTEASKNGFFAGMYSLIEVAIRKGTWAFFLLNVETIGPGIFEGIGFVGRAIAGSNLEGQPTELIDIGKTTLVNLAVATWKGGLLGITATTLIALCAGGCVLLVFASAGWVLALTMLYVKIVAVGGLLLVGLTALDATAQYGWRYVEFLVKGGLKQLGIALVLGYAASFVQQWRVMAESAAIPGPEILNIALSMVTSGMGLVFLLLMVPQLTSSMATGAFNDAGEGKLGGAATSLAMAGVGWAIGQMSSGASPGAVDGSNGGQTPEQRAQMLVQAASSGMPSSGASTGGVGGAAPSASASSGAPRTPAGAADGASSPEGSRQGSAAGAGGGAARSSQDASGDSSSGDEGEGEGDSGMAPSFGGGSGADGGGSVHASPRTPSGSAGAPRTPAIDTTMAAARVQRPAEQPRAESSQEREHAGQLAKAMNGGR